MGEGLIDPFYYYYCQLGNNKIAILGPLPKTNLEIFLFYIIIQKNKENTKLGKPLPNKTKIPLPQKQPTKVTRSSIKAKTALPSSAVCAPAVSKPASSAPVKDEPLIIELTQALDLTEKNKATPKQ